MKSREIVDYATNRVLLTEEVIISGSDTTHEPTAKEIERLRKMPWCIAAIEDPAEVWFLNDEKHGAKNYIQRYLASFLDDESDEAEYAAVTARMVGPCRFEVTELVVCSQAEFESGKYRNGILVHSADPKPEWTDQHTGVCWAEGILYRMWEKKIFMVRDVRGEDFVFGPFEWTKDEVSEAAEFSSEYEKRKYVKDSVEACTTDPDMIVERPSVDTETGDIVTIQIYYRAVVPEGKKRAVHKFATAVRQEDGSYEIEDYQEISRKKEREEVLLGIIRYTREDGEYPHYVQTERGWEDRETGEGIDTHALLSAIDHPCDPGRKIWTATIVKSPRTDPLEIIHIEYCERKEDLEKYRTGMLLYQREREN